MAAKPLTTEEKNYLRSIYLTFMIGTDAVRTCFDQLHPPTDLVAHLANNKSAFESLKKDGRISKAVWEKLYPKRGASPTSDEFDITILICLLREMTPTVTAPRHTGFDQLPRIADESPEACLANIKYYRNFLAHPDKVKPRTLSCTTFDDLFARVGMAIKVLGNNQLYGKVAVAKQLNIDNDFAEYLEKFVKHEKQLEDLHKVVQQISKDINHLETLCHKSEDKSDELENELRCKEEEMEKKISDITSKSKLIETIERNVKGIRKQLDSLSKQQGDNSEKIKKLNEHKLSLKEGLQNTTKQLDALELKEEIHGQEIKDLQVNQQEGLANTAKQVDELKDVHGKEIKDLQVNQQNSAVKNIIDQTIAMIQTEIPDEVYIETRAVNKCLEDFRHCPLLVLASISGRGKSSLGLYLAEHFLRDDHGNYRPLLFSGNEIENKRHLIDFKKKYFIIIEDLFGRSNVRFDDETHKNILDILNINMKGNQCKCKLILTVRKTPGSQFDLFDKHEIFKQARIINLDDENFALTRDEKKNILINLLKQFSVSICNCTYRDSLASDTCDEPCMEMPGNTLKLCYKVVKDILNFDTYYGFPQACRLFSSNPSFTKMGVKYFQNPNKALVEEMESLHTDAIAKSVIERYQFCILVYLAVKDEIDLYNVDKIFFGHLLDKFGDSNFTPNALKRSVKEISDKYLVGDFITGPCRLQHATIREAILISYGKEYPDEILSECSFEFFLEYFRPMDFHGIYICIADKMIIDYLLLKLSYVDINIVKQYIEMVSLNLCTETSDHVLSFFKNSTRLLDDGKYSGILNALMGQRVPDQFEPYIGQTLKELLKMEDVDIISKFIRPNGCLRQEQNAVKVDNEILARRLLNILVGISYCSTFSPNDSYNDFANTCDEQYLFDETSGIVDKAKQNAIGRYLYKVGLKFDGNNFVEKFLSMVEEHITNMNPIILEYMIDGFTGSGRLKDVVSQYKSFFERYLFRYGSIDVVLNLCCPSSYEGSSDTYVKVNNSILAEKLLSHLTVLRQEINDNDSDSDHHEYDYNQYDDNESDDFCDPLVKAVGEYVYTFGIEKNDEKFIFDITQELFNLFPIRDREEFLPLVYSTGRYLDRNLCNHFLYKGLNCEENREKIQQFPFLDYFIKQFNSRVAIT